MNIHRQILWLITGFLILSWAIPAKSAPALAVTPGYEAYEEALLGMRLRSLNNTGGSELYLGIPDLGTSGVNRAERNIRWAATNAVSFSFNPQADSLNLTVVNSNDTYSLDYPNVSAQVSAFGKSLTVDDLNVMQITLADRDDGTVEFKDVAIGDQLLGDFSGSGWLDWMVRGFDFSQGFELTGTLMLSGTFSNSAEKSKVDIRIGYEIIPDTTAPATTIDDMILNHDVIAPDLGAVEFHFSGADETSTADNLSFECSLNNDNWTACASPTSYADLDAGNYTFAVRAIDEANNIDATPAAEAWTVTVTIPDTTAPTTTINHVVLENDVIAPNLGMIVLHFSGADETTATENLRFECSFNDSSWHACASPTSYADLDAGNYTFAVRAIDEANNTDATPAANAWGVRITYALYLPIVTQ